MVSLFAAAARCDKTAMRPITLDTCYYYYFDVAVQFHPALLTSTAQFATPAAAAAVPALGQPSMTASPLIASPPGSLKPMSPGSEMVVVAGSSSDVQPANCTLFVANIGQSCTEQDLRDVFGTYVATVSLLHVPLGL